MLRLALQFNTHDTVTILSSKLSVVHRLLGDAVVPLASLVAQLVRYSIEMASRRRLRSKWLLRPACRSHCCERWRVCTAEVPIHIQRPRSVRAGRHEIACAPWHEIACVYLLTLHMHAGPAHSEWTVCTQIVFGVHHAHSPDRTQSRTDARTMHVPRTTHAPLHGTTRRER